MILFPKLDPQRAGQQLDTIIQILSQTTAHAAS
jgi:hypothetical protein